MNVEEALKEAMSAHVADVRAPAMMGQAVRRRHRAHVTRFRTAGAAALTVLVAGSFPAYTALTSGHGLAPNLAPAPTPAGPAVASSGAPASDTPTALGDPSQAPTALGDPSQAPTALGDPSQEPTAVDDPSQEPTDVGEPSQAPTSLPSDEGVDTATMPPSAATAEPSDRSGLPQDLGDLGDGRAFGGVRVGYLPEGLQWGKWSGKNGFGTTSYTTTWAESGLQPGEYSVQMVIYEGAAAKRERSKLKDYRADAKATRVNVHGSAAVIATLGEASEITGDGGTPTIVWSPGRGLMAEAMISPDYARKLGADHTGRELKKIAEAVRPTG
ncbi:hypothetical protein ABZT47_39955 [Sphaerisporangium sp. NPDC005289]|uniref:hypothetical protein n=1 Tax=Sphaerisporangium sp. NPDC005289 TaxID=3155247 RepID=UPI0033A63404